MKSDHLKATWLCSYLRLIEDPETHYAYPHPSNRCYANSLPAEITLDHQSNYCVQPAYVDCPVYRGEEAIPPMPAEVASRRRRLLIIRTATILGALIIVVLGLLVWQGLLPPESSLSTGSPILQQTTAEVVQGAEMEMRLPDLEIAVYMPAGSFAQGGFISLIQQEPDLFPEAGPDWRRPRVINIEFYDSTRTLVPDYTFPSPIDVCFALSEADWRKYQANPHAYRIQYYDDGQAHPVWTDLPALAKDDNQQLCGQANHLSLFALAVQSQPDITPFISEPYTP